MSYTIKLGKTSKRKNSTSQSATWVESNISANLKQNTDTINPIFVFSLNKDMDDVAKYNYIQAFGCYYWINKFVSIRNNLFEVHCTRDPLATFKTDIENYNGYCLRTNVGGKFDMNYYDNLIAPSSSLVDSLVSTVNTAFSLGSKTIVFGFNGSGPERTQANVTNFYLTNSSDVESIFGQVFCNHDIVTNIVQRFQKTSENITMVKAFPFTKGSSTSSSSANVNIGEFTVLANGLRVMDVGNFSSGDETDPGTGYTFASRRFGDVYNLAIPSGHYGDYRDYDANFVDATLHLPLVGNISIAPQYLRYSTLELTYSIDLITGVGECTVRALKSGVSPKTVGVFNFTAGYDIPISAYVSNIAEITSQVMSVNPVGAVLDAVSNPSNITTLSNGSGMANVYLTMAYLEIKVQDSEDIDTVRGYKSMRKLKINSTTGNGAYFEYMNPSVEITGASPQEIDEINNIMRGGIFRDA